MTDRILTLIKSLNISPSQFADEIGVQRSSISHLIAGRNKPSLEFIQKILGRFPEINPEWILNGSGSMYKDGHAPEILADMPLIKEENTENQSFQEIPKAKRKRIHDTGGKSVEKIVFFFEDKTFQEYFPE